MPARPELRYCAGPPDARGDRDQVTHAAPAHTAPSDGPKPNAFKRLWRQYGLVGVGTYLGVYVVTLGGLYAVVKTGELVPENVMELAQRLDWFVRFDSGLLNKKTGDFALAWIATKFTEPLRLALTIAITPSVARLVGRHFPRALPK